MKKILGSKKKISRSKVIGLIACLACVTVFSQTTFAKGLFGIILQSFTTGHNQYMVVDSSDCEFKLPKEAVGLIFDKDKKTVETYKTGMDYYDKDGNKIEDYGAFIKEHCNQLTIESEDGTVKVSTQEDKSADPLLRAKNEGYPIIQDPSQINGYLKFTAKLPEYLPNGFKFYGASAYGTDYLFVYYTNEKGEYMVLHERIINDDTAYSTGTDGSIEEVTIHGQKAVMMDERCVDWETDGISISVNGRGLFSTEELIKVAESVQ